VQDFWLLCFDLKVVGGSRGVELLSDGPGLGREGKEMEKEVSGRKEVCAVVRSSAGGRSGVGGSWSL